MPEHLETTIAAALPFDLEAARKQMDDRLLRYTEFDEGCPGRLREAIRYSLLSPGKRLRPLLVLMAAEACGADPERALPAACAVEMVHTYSLIHDDLPSMDDDELRRGQPTLHVKFDEATAILAGDALIPLAFQIVCSEYPPSLAAPCCLELARACGATRLVGGQADDLARSTDDIGQLGRLEDIHRRKTGALLSVSLRLGGLVASASQEQHAALDVYGANLGLAFQIVDDLLDCRGDWITMGKTTGKDDARGRLTWPGLLGSEGAEQRARELISDAVEAIECLGHRAQPLKSLAGFVLERNR